MERFASPLYKKIEKYTKLLPGRLWRVYGSEYATPPYLSPDLFREYVVKYDQPIVNLIKKSSGYARIHSHGRIKELLNDISGMGWDAIDPIEPPPQGDVELAYVKEKIGENMVLFGNLEVSDIETLSTDLFEIKIKTALEQGTSGKGRGFVLMPSACPYGRILSDIAFNNYLKIVELASN
jgi:hypothetical protein